MTRVAYDPSFPVVASWALEFAPVSVAVVMMQASGNEHFCIASRAWFFEELANCLGEVREVFPWRIASHLIPPEPDKFKIWEQIFHDQALNNIEHAPDMPDNRRMLLTQLFLRRLHVDTAPRPWELEGNNASLLDALNGYRVKELSSHAEVFTLNVLGTHEQYLTRALEHYAAHAQLRRAPRWLPGQDYKNHDAAVIAGLPRSAAHA